MGARAGKGAGEAEEGAVEETCCSLRLGRRLRNTGKGKGSVAAASASELLAPPNPPRNEGQDQCRPPPLHMPGKRLRRKQCGMCVKHFLAIILNKTVWPSGLRRWLQAPIRKGMGSHFLLLEVMPEKIG